MTSRRLRAVGWRALCVALVLAASASPAISAEAEPAVGAINLPDDTGLGDHAVLSSDDIIRYGEIFRINESGEWARVDALVKKLDNPILLGHVLADRYLHPRYRTSYAELASWLQNYSDHPQADKLYALALKRRHKGDTAPKNPLRIAMKRQEYSTETDVPVRGTASQRRQVAKIRNQVRTYIGREQPTKAQNFLESGQNLKLLTTLEADEIRAWIANSYYLEHVDDKAFALARDVAERQRERLPFADWTAGLAAFRLGTLDSAAHHFEAVARAQKLSGWNRAAGGYWAARANLMAGAPDRVSANLKIAANEPTTFYGLLALRQLGQKPEFKWDLPAASAEDFRRALSIGAVGRAVAFGQIGEIVRADEEMRRGHGIAPPDLDSALIALSNEYHLAGAQLHVADIARGDGLEGARYPIPPYRPENGFQVDPALIYAFMRQESRFKPQAKSGAGATGLMQIMPLTAVHISKDRSLKSRNRDRLYDPSYNLTLAQNYIEELMAHVQPKGNLFMLTVAYNGGPGNLRRWTNEMKINDDPLLFIESIPARETRVYVERVLTNLWLYRYRMGESLASLDQVAQGEWPLYDVSAPPAGSSSNPTSGVLTPGPR